MNLGIIGLPQVGKRSIFHLLTGLDPEKAPTRDGIRHGIAPVRDPRIDRLSRMYNPKRTRYAEFDTALPPDVQPNAARSAAWIDPIRKSDALLHVVRAFDAPHVFHVEGSVDPKRDIDIVNTEFLLADLALTETRLTRITKEGKAQGMTPARQQEKAIIERCMAHLEDEKPLRTLQLSSEDARTVSSLQFLTQRPVVVALNVGEDLEDASLELAELRAALEREGDTVVFLSAAIEAELAELEAEEQAAFMEELGLTEPAAHRLSRATYNALGLMSFFTVGPDEVRAWPVPLEATAPEAAGKIHSDIERGFIRAETLRYEDLVSAGSEKAARDKALYRLNGKDYVVQDGDIMEFRFSV